MTKANMKRSRTSIQVWIVTAAFTMLAPRLARGDGGIVQLRENKGPFSVTVFVAPEAALGEFADVSVLVQGRTNAEVILDADVSLTADPPGGVAINQSDTLCGAASDAAAFPDLTQHQVKAQATREQASNKLLYAAPLKLSATGNWRLHVLVSRGSDSESFDCLLPVTRSSTLAGLWPYLAFPPLGITAFAINQRLRKHSLEKEPLNASRGKI
jgi:hypothetical protein